MFFLKLKQLSLLLEADIRKHIGQTQLIVQIVIVHLTPALVLLLI